ncbi:MAG: hypothetical protein V3U76_07925 [Granulosicoccus sp.]
MNRLRFISTLLMFAVMLLAGASLRAADRPVIFALDASLPTDALKTADAAIMSIAMQVPSDSEISLIVFDNVVQQVVPLQLAAGAQFAAFEKALGRLKHAETGNLAAGIERALDEVSERSGAHLIVFARGVTDAENTEKQLSYRQWIKELLLPSAAEKGIAITLISPETGADAELVAELLNQPANNSLLLQADAGLANQVLGLLSATGAAEILADAAQTPGDLAAGTGQPEFTATPPDRVAEPVALSPASDVVAAPSEKRQAARSRVHYIWYAAIALLTMLVPGLLLSQWRKRASNNDHPADKAVSESAYLPLQTTRQGPFRSHDSTTVAHDNARPRSAVLSDTEGKFDDSLDQTDTQKKAIDKTEQLEVVTKQRDRPQE